MQYRFLKPNGHVTEIELDNSLDIHSACWCSTNDEIAVGLTRKSGEGQLKVYESSGKSKIEIDCFEIYDCVYDKFNNNLLLSNGHTFFSCSPEQSKLHKLCKYSHIKYAPNRCSISPTGKYIGLLKYRADSDRFHVIDLEKKELIDVKLICCSYSWIDDYTIIYSTVGGKIGYYDLRTRKKTNSQFNIKSILASDSTSLTELQNKIRKVEKEKLSWIHFDDPIRILDSTYFVMNSGKLAGSALLKFEGSKYEVLFESDDKIQTYDLDNFNNARMNISRSVNMKFSYYSLVQESGEFNHPNTDFYLNQNGRMNQLIRLK
ncbi:MAG: hypothetical protein AAF363_08350 [Bacteroidota bacterium]